MRFGPSISNFRPRLESDPTGLRRLGAADRRNLRFWRDEFGPTRHSVGPKSLVIAYYASAEWGCLMALGWPMPAHVLDLFVEFRCRTNGLETPAGSSLVGALTYLGLDGIDAGEKTDMRDLILRGGPWSDRASAYCHSETDVVALANACCPWRQIDLPRALLRGRYMAAAAPMEHAGVPIDGHAGLLRQHWTAIQDELIADDRRQLWRF